MTERELISKLNSFQNVNPDQNWLKSNRDLLLTQISNSGATKLSIWKIFIINLESLAKTSLQPAIALSVFVFILISGSLFSHQLFNKTKPNDSLYIARIISEKAKLNLVLNSDNREKMAAQFAASHAQDIASTLADPQFNQAANQDQIAILNESFNKEIETVQNRVNKLAQATTKNSAATITANPDDLIFSAAENKKDNQGIQISESVNPNVLNVNNSTNTATTSLATVTPLTVSGNASTEILDEAKQSFENKDYNKVIDKLKEVEEIIK
jgi:hypothetical protein